MQLGIVKDDILNRIKIPVPPLEYQIEMEITLNKLDELNDYFYRMIIETDEHIKTAFMNSMDDYGNPNGFNLDKVLDDA